MKTVILSLSIIAAMALYSFLRPAIQNCVYIAVEIADTPQARQTGLSGREMLGENTGMLFVHENPGIQGYWMRGMRFPLDFVWLDDDMRVVGVEENISPETYPEVFYSPNPVRFVLETNAGWVEKNNILIGDKICYTGTPRS